MKAFTFDRELLGKLVVKSAHILPHVAASMLAEVDRLTAQLEAERAQHAAQVKGFYVDVMDRLIRVAKRQSPHQCVQLAYLEAARGEPDAFWTGRGL